MTEQNQTQDPQTQNDQNLDQNSDQDTGIFGGSDDIFENSDILEPIEDETKKDSLEDLQELEPEIVETIPEIKEDVEEATAPTKIEHE
jgi:hypothetical protein